MSQSEKIDQLFTALSKVQASLQGAKKDASNPFFKSKYADLESCWDACRKLLAENGLCVVQTMDSYNGIEVLVTTLGHSSGQWIGGSLPLNMKSKDPQGQGSAISYARRYSLAAIVGLVQTDDDGEAAMDRGPSGKGMVEPGNGTQKEGPRLPQLPKDLVDRLIDPSTGKSVYNPTGKLIEELYLDTTHAIINYLDVKYSEKEMPAKTAELHEYLIGHAMKLEGIAK